jgi:hypothetical protein
MEGRHTSKPEIGLHLKTKLLRTGSVQPLPIVVHLDIANAQEDFQVNERASPHVKQIEWPLMDAWSSGSR